VLEETEDFTGEEDVCEVLSVKWLKLPLLEDWLNVGLRFFPTDGLKPHGMETEVGVWLKSGRLDVVVIPATCDKAEDDEVDFGTRNA
jgi:hypothetical protein